uniref:Dynein light intermediate chain n=1 Tax=Heterorhabditis bacteriophora TaxID=37862 RepID=A0A1I7XPX0_HETBA
MVTSENPGLVLLSSAVTVVGCNMPQPEEEKIWTRILSEVSSKSSSTLQGGTVIILGENQSGKSSLLARLEKNDNQGQGSALEYHFLNVQNDFRDGSYAYQLGTAGGLGPAENISLPVWVLDGDEYFAPLIQYALPPISPAKTVVLLVASIDNPGLLHSLRRWANLFNQQVNLKYDKTVISEAKKLQERFWQEYVEPIESSMTSSMVPGAEDSGLLPLEQGVLVENCGASFVVVITKSDLAIKGSELSDQQADRILVQVRHFCLQLGAALVYTSSKNVKNIQRLSAVESAVPFATKKTNLLEEATENNSPLASFFSNLLKDKPGVAKSTAPPPADSQAQLDRILKSASQGKDKDENSCSS